jgi:hypothetical protein
MPAADATSFSIRCGNPTDAVGKKKSNIFLNMMPVRTGIVILAPRSCARERYSDIIKANPVWRGTKQCL